MTAYIAAISYHLPDNVLTNGDLQSQNSTWDMSRLGPKVGIVERRIAGEDETASDLGFHAAQKLLDGLKIDRACVDMLLFCTQSPDYQLPATACILQARLGLPTTCGALDFNQGCSGYVYGLYLAKAMISSGMARNVLLITAETYSKIIHPNDRSVRPLFGDGASATLVNSEASGAEIGEFTLGTDGSGFDNLIVPAGGARAPRSSTTSVVYNDDAGSMRSDEHLYMNGPEILRFTLLRIPELVADTLNRANLVMDDIDWFIFHQANAFMNERLRAKIGIPREKTPLFVENCGNTVSSTIPITLHANGASLKAGERVMLVGFGVGYSWGACLLRWSPVSFL